MACSNDTDPDDHGFGNPATAPVDYLGAINQGKNKAVVDAALKREESRGVHLRTDFPNLDDDNWNCHLRTSKSG